MKPYQDLTYWGRLRRMRQLARLALQEYGLAQTTNRWQDAASAVVLTLLTSAFFLIYLQRSAAAAALLRNPRSLFTLIALWLVFLA